VRRDEFHRDKRLEGDGTRTIVMAGGGTTGRRLQKGKPRLTISRNGSTHKEGFQEDKLDAWWWTPETQDAVDHQALKLIVLGTEETVFPDPEREPKQSKTQ
jgi:hypothetical protein